MMNKQRGKGEGVPGLNLVSPFSSLAGQSYQNQCFPDPKNAPAGSGTPGIGVLATPPACLPARAADTGSLPAGDHISPAHHHLTTPQPRPASQLAPVLPWCPALFSAPLPTPSSQLSILPPVLRRLASHSDLSLRVISLESTVTWMGSHQPSRQRCPLCAEVSLGILEGRSSLLVISACPGSVLSTFLLNEGL